MKRSDYERLREKREIKNPATIRHDDFAGSIPEERTLLWGYTLGRESFHVYKAGGELHRVIYSFPNEVIDYVHGDELAAELLNPSKRVYPEATCYEFIVALRAAEQEPMMTSFNDEREESRWYGEKYEDLVDLRPL